MKKLLAIALIFSATSAFAVEKKGPDAQAINSACSAEATAAGCAGDKVGTGLLKCIRSYKKTHSDFKPSPDCKAALKKARQDRKARKAKAGA